MSAAPGRWTAARARRWRRRWDLQQERYILHREFRFDLLVGTVAVAAGSRPRVLDLGCGTGSLTERLLRRVPRARVVAVDFDPVTLALGRVGLGSMRGRLRWIDADLRTPGWVRGLPPGRFDAVMSSTALHWLTAAQLRRLYRQLAGRVRPGGIFLNADGMRFRPESVRLTRLARKLRTQRVRESPRRGETWDAWWLAVGREPALAAEMAEHGRRFPHGHERTPTLDFEGHRAALRRAGFREAEGVFGMWEYRILAAIR